MIKKKVMTVAGAGVAIMVASAMLCSLASCQAPLGVEGVSSQHEWQDADAVQLASLGLMPLPATVQIATGAKPFVLDADTAIVVSDKASAEAAFLAKTLRQSTGLALPIQSSASGSVIALELDETLEIGDEAYRLVVDAHGVHITARTSAGIFYGCQTFLQLMPSHVYRQAVISSDSVAWQVPAVRIEDQPRLSWRGLLIDPARHFIPKDQVLQMIDAMAAMKMNRLQMHLTDDQGWRIEILRYPRLTDHSAWRKGTWRKGIDGRMSQDNHDNVVHGGYYTQDDLREIVAYAQARHVIVIPEIEMPGHARSWIAAYPEMGVYPKKQTGMELWVHWGVSRDVLAMRSQTVEMACHILDEVCAIFPSPWIHIGGDEAPRKHWEESEEMQLRAKELGLENVHLLQGWFNQQIAAHLATYDRRMMGWDEILEGNVTLPQDALVMSWRGEKGGIHAAKMGHDVVMAPQQWVYLDYGQAPPSEERPSFPRSNSLHRVYRYNPVPEKISEDRRHHVLGLQAELWGEYLPSDNQLEYMAFPRGCAIAEVGWSKPDKLSFGNFMGRLPVHMKRMQVQGVSPRPLHWRRVVADASGELVLDWRHAVLHGVDISRYKNEVGGCVANWKKVDSFVTWEMRVDVAGTYKVELELACPKDSAGNSFAVDVFGQTLTGEVPATGGWQDFVTYPVGDVVFPEAGCYTLDVRALEQIVGGGFMNLHAVHLQPANQ